MNLKVAAEKLGLKLICGSDEGEYKGVYAGDLLSWVMSRLAGGQLWLTIMSNVNVVAVASLCDASAVILAEGVILDSDALAAAKSRGINVFSSDKTIYDLCVGLAEIEK